METTGTSSHLHLREHTASKTSPEEIIIIIVKESASESEIAFLLLLRLLLLALAKPMAEEIVFVEKVSKRITTTEELSEDVISVSVRESRAGEATEVRVAATTTSL